LGQPVKIKILEHEYLIKSDEKEVQVYRIAEYVNNKLREIQAKMPGLSEKKTAILAALDIAGEYFQLKKENDELLTDRRQRTEALIHNIDSVIG